MADVELVRETEISQDLSFVNYHAPAETGGHLIKLAKKSKEIARAAAADHCPALRIVKQWENGLPREFSFFPAILVKCPPCLSWRVVIDETEISGDLSFSYEVNVCRRKCIL